MPRVCPPKIRFKKLFSLLILIFLSAHLFASEYTKLLSKSFESYSAAVKIALEDDFKNPQSLKSAAQKFQNEISEFKKSDAFKYDKIHKSENVKIVERIESCLEKTIFADDSDFKNAAVENFFAIQNEMFKFYRANDTLFASTTRLFLVLLVGISLLLVLMALLGTMFIQKISEKEKREVMLKTTIDVQERERSRISRDLHDTVVQDARSVLFFTEKLKTLVPQGEQSELVSTIISIEQENLNEMRSIIKNLSPPELDKNDFRTIVVEYCNKFSRNSKLLNPENPLECKFFAEQNVPFEKLSSDQKLHLFRIIQEALNNAQKHAKAEECSVIFRFADNVLTLLICDDGIGFDAENFSDAKNEDENGTHIGLRGMKARAELLGGKLRIKSNETGTEIIFEMKMK